MKQQKVNIFLVLTSFYTMKQKKTKVGPRQKNYPSDNPSYLLQILTNFFDWGHFRKERCSTNQFFLQNYSLKLIFTQGPQITVMVKICLIA